MTRWREGQFLLFGKSVAKITKIGVGKYGIKQKGIIKMRKFSKGNTQHGYSWQHQCKKEQLDRLYKKRKVKIVSPEEMLQFLFYNYEGGMPIKDVRGE